MRPRGRFRPVLGCRLAYAAARAAPSAHTAEPGCLHYLIFIGVDGLGAGLLRGLIGNDLAGAFANLRRFVDEGTTAFNSRSDYTHTYRHASRPHDRFHRPVIRTPRTTATRTSDLPICCTC
ncbi:MAG: hypothetical protein JRS35_21005 [Deltaproteobacteria bacterium]|nr:hypothetical protein [Deltaproteobacteria bacterium]